MASTAELTTHRLPFPTPERVLRLQAAKGYPAVSVLLNTTPSHAMTAVDRDRLRALVADAERRLADERLPGEREVMTALQLAAADALAGPTSSAVAVFASRALSMAVRLPVPVVDRVVIDPTFATRDLVRALHRMPRHVVLVLNGREARLFEGGGRGLRAVTAGFPMRDDRERQHDAARPRRTHADAAAFFRRVDRALGAYLALQPAPLVLVGADRAVAQYRGVSRNLGRLAGTVVANIATEPLSELARRIDPVLERYLLSRQQEALELLSRRVGAHLAVSGMRAAWLAARHEQPEMLAVEQSLFYPARLSSDGDLLIPADDVEHPDVIDDAVDELIELVLERGGWVALVDDGLLAAHEGVGLTLHAEM